ncbi:DNA-methyltransferase [Mycetocola zhujimingii]|uniref:DNA-methyltransferase n=1 Tax=Mycetocola zhujimingii TaxID=2079792 RepID=UPI0013C45B1F|nr:site-specific DNA-methyltransferase [Mycetocola zhujimingii]
MSDTAAVPGANSSATAEPDFWTVHQGDARDIGTWLRRAAHEAGSDGAPFLQTTITSPPYATLVDYGSDNQIGFGQSYEDYLESCRSIFESVHQWTLDSGSMWVVADSLMERRRDGKPSRLVPLPFDLATQAKSVGWTLREVIIWRKDRTRPWSHHGKLRNGFEYVLFFVKSNSFTFNVDRLRDTGSLKSWWVKYPERHNPWGMTPDNVWEIPIPVQGSWDDSAFRHACPFPPELVRRMVTLSSEEGDVVFDPFAGSGSVVTGALEEGRRGLGVELNPDYVSLFHKSAPTLRRERSEAKSVSVMTQRLLELRMLKYPKELARQILRSGFTALQVRAVLMVVESVNYEFARTGYGTISCSVVVVDELSELETARLSKILAEVTARAPLSKYGLDVRCEVVSVDEASAQFPQGDVSVYTKGRAWSADFTLAGTDVGRWIHEAGVPTVVPVISPLHVRQSLEESS